MNPANKQDPELERFLRRYRPAAPSPELKRRVLAAAGPVLEKTAVHDPDVPWQKACRPLWAAAAAIVLVAFTTHRLGPRILPAPRPLAQSAHSENAANERLQELAIELGLPLVERDSCRRPQDKCFYRLDDLELERALNPDNRAPAT